MKKVVIAIMVAMLIVGCCIGGYFLYDKVLKGDVNISTDKKNKEKEEEKKPTTSNDNKKEPMKFTLDNYENGKLIEITGDEFKQLIEDESSFIILFSQSFCGHCKKFKPVLEEFVKDKDYPILYMEIDLLEGESREFYYNFIRVSGTPTMTYIYNGKELDESLRIDGYTESAYVEKFVEDVKEYNYKRVDEETGDTIVVYPDFTGCKLSEVLAFCDKYNINLVTEYVSTKECELDIVVAQSIAAGTTILEGKELKIYLADPRI